MKVNNNSGGTFEQFSQTQNHNGISKSKIELSMPGNNDIVVRSCLFRDENLVLSPMIFTKKVNNLKMDDRVSPQTMVLESLYAIVNKVYYKSSYDLEEFFKELKSVFNSERTKPEPKSRGKNFALSIRRSKRIRKNSNQKTQATADTNGNGKEQATLIEEKNILDFLISPIKPDFCFGNLTRKLDNQGIGYF
jgi:hypothetical protein